MVAIEIRLVGFDRIVGKLTPRLYLAAQVRLLNRATILGQREARDAAPEDLGALKRSILRDVQATSGKVYSMSAYAATMENGRRKGAPPPPPAALVGWIKRHGFRGSPFVLARAISRRGIKGRFFFRKATTALEQALPDMVARMGREIGEGWGR